MLKDEYIQKLLSLFGQITVMVAGKPRTGKSTVLNNLFDVKLPARASPTSVTTVVIDRSTSIDGLQVRYIDAPGLTALDMDNKKTLSDMSRKIGRGDDSFTLLFCLSMMNTIDNSDKKILKDMTDRFGASIWKKCILVLTYCDTARSQNFESEDQDVAYREHLRKYAELFRKSLQSCTSDVPPVKVIFDCQEGEITPDTIVAVPVAKTREDGMKPNILPGFKIGGNICWTEYAFVEILRKVKTFSITEIKHKYSLSTVAVSTVAGGVIIGGTGAAVGAGIGGIVGLVGGPPGVAVGAAIGATAGVAVGTVSSFIVSLWRTTS